MPAANLFDAITSVRSILLRRHLRKQRQPFVKLSGVELPIDHELHAISFLCWLPVVSCVGEIRDEPSNIITRPDRLHGPMES
jgi:hypothetical protein